MKGTITKYDVSARIATICKAENIETFEQLKQRDFKVGDIIILPKIGTAGMKITPRTLEDINELINL